MSAPTAAQNDPISRWDVALAAGLIGAGLAADAWFAVYRPIHGLGNDDISGIAYEADVLRAGGLPYVDTLELKSPVPFFLVAAAWSVFGRSPAVLHAACHAWVLLGAVGVAVGVWWAEIGVARSTRLRLLGLAVGLYLAEASAFDSNYTTWMLPPSVWAFAAAVVGLRTGDLRWHTVAGFAAGLAYLTKANAVVLGVAIPLAWAWVWWRGPEGARLGAWASWVVGAALAALPFLGVYAVHGETMALVRGVFPFGQAAAYSVRDVEVTAGTLVAGLAVHQWKVLRLSFLGASTVTLGLTLAAVGRWRAPGDARVRFELPLLAFWALSLVGGGLGGLRYYSGYAPQYIPPLVWLAASSVPWRLAAGASTRLGRGLFRGLVGAAAIAGIAVATDRFALGSAGARYRPNPGCEVAGAYIAAHSRPDDRVQVFGIRAWAVYFWSERRAPGRIYKSLGAVTEFNRNGLFQPPRARRKTTLDFLPGPLADELYETFVDTPPAFVVRAKPFFGGYTNDPIRDFVKLQALLDRDYVFVRDFGDLDVYERRGHAGP